MLIDASRLQAYEDGQLDDDEVAALFQELIDSGLVWQPNPHFSPWGLIVANLA